MKLAERTERRFNTTIMPLDRVVDLFLEDGVEHSVEHELKGRFPMDPCRLDEAMLYAVRQALLNH